MKIHGKELEGPSEEVLVIPRKGEDIVFKAKAVLNYDEFDAICPAPQPPMKMVPGGKQTAQPNDKDFLAQLDEYAEHRSNWMILKSLSATPGLEWDTVQPDDPKTWGNFKTELAKAGLSPLEATKLMTIITKACGLNQEIIDEATERFLAGGLAQPESESYPVTEQESTPSGEPVSVSE